MGRLPRIHLDYGTYHVMARGNGGQFIFADPEDKAKIIAILRKAFAEAHATVFSHCIMDNHFHLQPRVGVIPLDKIMHLVNLRYAKYFHDKYGTEGHLFQERYEAKLCMEEDYLLAVLRYIHNNPVAAGIAKRPEDWPWSSYGAYLGKPDPLSDPSFMLELLGGEKFGRENFLHLMQRDPNELPNVEFESDPDLVPEESTTLILPKGNLRNIVLRKFAEDFCRAECVPIADFLGRQVMREWTNRRRRFGLEALAKGFTTAEVARLLDRSFNSTKRLLNRQVRKRVN